MKKDTKRIVITILIIVSMVTIFFGFKELINKNKLPEKSINNITKNKSFAIMITNDNGIGYQEYEGETWPEGYNLTKSECVDSNGNAVKEVITYDESTKKVTLKTKKTVYCTLYFDKMEILDMLRKNDPNEVISKDLVGGMYRYQGVSNSEYANNELKVVDNNYICFGAASKENCINNEDKYMYRIIGVTSKGNIKVVKKTTLSETYKTNETIAATYPESNLYKKLNSDSDSFFNSLSKELQDKIVSYDWQYGSLTKEEANNNGLKLYEIESNLQGTINDKIGMLYFHDYYLSYNNTINCFNGEPDASKCYNSWLHLHNNDTTPADPYGGIEWLLPRFSGEKGWWYIRGCDNNQCGFTYYHGGDDFPCSLRPVFYLDNNIKLLGSGKLDDPYIVVFQNEEGND